MFPKGHGGNITWKWVPGKKRDIQSTTSCAYLSTIYKTNLGQIYSLHLGITPPPLYNYGEMGFLVYTISNFRQTEKKLQYDALSVQAFHNVPKKIMLANHVFRREIAQMEQFILYPLKQHI